MKKLAAIALACLVLSACLTTEDGKVLLTEAGKWIIPEGLIAFIVTEDDALVLTEDNRPLQFQLAVPSLVTETGDYIVTETNDDTLEI